MIFLNRGVSFPNCQKLKWIKGYLSPDLKHYLPYQRSDLKNSISKIEFQISKFYEQSDLLLYLYKKKIQRLYSYILFSVEIFSFEMVKTGYCSGFL